MIPIKNKKKTLEVTVEEMRKFSFSYIEKYAPSKQQIKTYLLKKYLKSQDIKLNKQDIKLKIIGLKKFTVKLNRLLKTAENKTKNNKTLQLNLAINYGSKSELIYAIKKLNKQNKRINEKNLNLYLQTKNIPDPDLLIRTGNTKRLSNFLLWQLAYSEIFFEKKLWPDFNEKDYKKIIIKYKMTKRNYGNI